MPEAEAPDASAQNGQQPSLDEQMDEGIIRQYSDN